MRKTMALYDGVLFPALGDFTKQILPGRGLATTGNKWLARHCPNVACQLCSCSIRSHHPKKTRTKKHQQIQSIFQDFSTARLQYPSIVV